MAGEIAPASRYALSFTSGALLMREAVIAAPLYLRERDWSKVRALIARRQPPANPHRLLGVPPCARGRAATRRADR